MRNKPCLTTEDVQRVVAAAKKHATKLKREPTIAVVDEGGHLLYLERPDVNGVNTVDMSTAKARTAALRGRPSGAFGKRVRERPEFLMSPNYLGVEGGHLGDGLGQAVGWGTVGLGAEHGRASCRERVSDTV